MISGNKIIERMEILYQQRILRGISRAELAEKMGISETELAKIENKELIPSIGIMQKYSEGLFLIAVSPKRKFEISDHQK